jgi:hypothetical protein
LREHSLPQGVADRFDDCMKRGNNKTILTCC